MTTPRPSGSSAALLRLSYPSSVPVRFWLGSGVLAAVSVAVVILMLVANPAPLPVRIIVAVLVAIPAIVAAFAFAETHQRWGGSERLAVEVRAEGVRLGPLPLLPWGEVDRVTVIDADFSPIWFSLRQRLAGALMGNSPDQQIVFQLRDGSTFRDSVPRSTRFLVQPVIGENPARVAGVFGQGLSRDEFLEAVAIITERSRAAGVTTVDGREG
ncbi:MAG: hypothetical protein ACTJHU_07600 [Mycetocola sp.]